MQAKVEISKRLMLINSCSSLIARLISVSVLLWLQQYLLRRISIEEYSLLPVVYAVMAFVPLITSVMTGGLGRYVVEAYAVDDGKRITAIVSTMVPLLASLAILIGCLASLLIWQIDLVLNIPPTKTGEAQIMLGILFSSLLIRLVLEPFSIGLYVKQKFVVLNCVMLGGEIFRLGLLCMLLFGVGTKVVWVVVAAACTETLTLFVNIAISSRLLPELRFRFHAFESSIAKEITSFGGWTSIGQIARVIRQRADIIVLNKLGTPVEVTCMYLGSLAYGQLRVLMDRVTAPLDPPLVAMFAQRDMQRLQRAYLKGGKYAMWAALLISTPIIVFHQQIFRLYLVETYDLYAKAGLVTVLILLSLCFACANQMVWKIARAAADIGPLTRRLCVVQCINLLLTIYLVGAHQLGAIGAASSSLVMTLVSVPFLYLPEACRLTGLKKSDWLSKTVWPGIQPAIVSGGVLVFVRYYVAQESWLTLLLASMFGGITFIVWLYLFNLEKSEKRDVKQLWKGMIRRIGLG